MLWMTIRQRNHRIELHHDGLRVYYRGEWEKLTWDAMQVSIHVNGLTIRTRDHRTLRYSSDLSDYALLVTAIQRQYRERELATSQSTYFKARHPAITPAIMGTGFVTLPLLILAIGWFGWMVPIMLILGIVLLLLSIYRVIKWQPDFIRGVTLDASGVTLHFAAQTRRLNWEDIQRVEWGNDVVLVNGIRVHPFFEDIGAFMELVIQRMIDGVLQPYLRQLEDGIRFEYATVYADRVTSGEQTIYIADELDAMPEWLAMQLQNPDFALLVSYLSDRLNP
jgi:hypothetical protein